ncbi:bifunctional 2',3'-cyclic-nucleotide 2'-phosphodiesterase/3'-nucleotidase [Marinagarivorans algicola]|uniref:bifunctional 2',3'-cyclic-nucleotide 2'-phosphodiesterase/3'-nucleotidase n=1 Tax=Marinagarivorans algicola TaxID=1513270 RepID=UPI0009E9426E|nr:bifunctional 2',3'-cyclic-nucleotide 2'-phosphodiesterase/3'-nucleotidase [Marinagarivorans algicola]
MLVKHQQPLKANVITAKKIITSALLASCIALLTSCGSSNKSQDNTIEPSDKPVKEQPSDDDKTTSDNQQSLQLDDKTIAELITIFETIKSNAVNTTFNSDQQAVYNNHIDTIHFLLNTAEELIDHGALADEIADLNAIVNAENFARLRLMETTDIHAYLTDVNYYSDTIQTRFGLSRTASLIKTAREEVINSVLVDNGDLIQGNPIGDWMAAKGIVAGEVHPVYQAMNLLGYDVANYGNHEFNYGLAFLKESVNDANFPYISANIYKPDGDTDPTNDQHYFDPYTIIEKTIKDNNGQDITLKIGFIGFVPPQILVWDKKNLTGKVTVKDIAATAKELIPKMRAEGADIIVAIPHSGISTAPYDENNLAEHSSYYLSQVEGIDAIMFGHSHSVFPSEAFADVAHIDIEKGTINRVPAVMPGYWGSHLGIIDLELAYDKDSQKWNVFDHRVSTPSIDSENVVTDAAITAALADADTQTSTYMNQPIGSASDDMFSFLALVQDDPSVQIVSDAQKDYVEQLIQGDVNLQHLPVLSAAAPFKACARSQDCSNESDFVTVKKGDLALKDAADLYLYPNTLQVVKINGDELTQWLECAAGMFNQIDTTSSEPQELISTRFPTYNFDVIDGVTYQIDVTQPARYAEGCTLDNEAAQRIINLTFNDEPVTTDMEFLVATNNYRAGGGGSFPGTGGEHVVIEAPDANRDVLANYIRSLSAENGTVNPSADNNWQIARINSATELNIIFYAPDTKRVSDFINKQQLYPIRYIKASERGAMYNINLQANNSLAN